jgi:uncharacterized protein with GYD domain
MAKYLIRGNYVASGVKGLMAEGGSKRRDAAEAAIKSAGGTLEAFYFAFGDTDVVGICDFPDAASAVALSLLINSTGAVSLSMTPLLTCAEVDAATKKSPSYRPPGG